jgi:type VI secretion system secreted protein VgrG
MVDFLHGDPDRPVVMGWVFNNSLKPVYPLPANKTRAVWRTKRYGKTGQYPNAKALDTGTPGANELRFEDKGGAEEVFLHAERDMNTRIRFEETHHVGATQHIMVGYDRTDDVGRHETTTIGTDQKLTVGGNQTEEIGAKREITVGATDKLTVGQSMTVTAGTSIEMTANTSITLKCGPSSIKIDPSGVTIKGPMIKVDASGMATVQSPMTQVKGSGLVKVEAPVVMIN